MKQSMHLIVRAAITAAVVTLASGSALAASNLQVVDSHSVGVFTASGGAFGAVSWFYYGRLPDIHGIAIAALLVKMACAAAGFMLAGAYLYSGIGWSERAQKTTWRTLTLLAATALTAAAFLRWFS